MSSGTAYAPGEGASLSRAVSGQVISARDNARIARLGMSPRQQELNRLWTYYCAAQYDTRRIGWDGKEHDDPLAREAIATAGFLPPGYYDAGQTLPLKFRRPSAPYHLCRVITNRFTGLVFSERRNPQIKVEGDPITEDFLRTLAEVARFWPAMIQARTYGGAMGSVAVGFQFIEGRPVVEVHDPRWCYPQFLDRHTLTLGSLEIRYQYPEEVQDPKTGEWLEIPFWYRRVLDEEQDVVFEPEPVGDGEEPAWKPAVVVNHGLGECPAVWVQNAPVPGQIDGEPDCHGIYDTVEAIDALLAQAHRGVLANCDPTVHIATDQPLSEVRKGSDNAIKTERGGSVSYVELNGSGPKAACEMAFDLRAKALEVAQCVLDAPAGGGGGMGDPSGSKTATEVRHKYASMVEKADILREQYGERCVKPLLRKMERATRQVQEAKPENGQMVRGQLKLPPKVEKTEGGGITKQPRQLGAGGIIHLHWPPYFEPTIQDALQATQAVVAAKTAQIIDEEAAAQYVAPFFNVEDVQEMRRKIRVTAESAQAELEAMALGGYTMPTGPATGGVPGKPSVG